MVPQSAAGWAAAADSTLAKFSIGLFFLWYAAERMIGMARNIKQFGGIPFDKRHGITSTMKCSLNMAVALVLIVAVFEVIVKGGEFLARIAGSETARVVALAYTPPLFTAALLALGLIGFVYWWLLVRHRNHEIFKIPFGEKLRRMRAALKARGVSDVQVLMIPLVSLGSNALIWAAPYLAAG